MQTTLFWVAVVAIICWALGAYNRLVRQRAAVRNGFLAVDEIMRAECAQLLLQAPAGATEASASQDTTPAASMTQVEGDAQAGIQGIEPSFDPANPMQSDAFDFNEAGADGQAAVQAQPTDATHAHPLHSEDELAEQACAEAWQSCIAAVRQLDAALAQARLEPVDEANMAMVSTAYQVVEQAVDRLREKGVYRDSRFIDKVENQLPDDWMQWAQLEVKLAEHIRSFNEAAQTYNHAIHAWPARAIALFLSFRDAGTLSGLRHE